MQVLSHGEVARHLCVHGGEVRMRKCCGAMLSRVDAVNVYRTGRGLQHLQYHIDGRRFAGTIGAEKSDDLAFADRERNTAYGGHIAILFFQVAYSKYVLHGDVSISD